MKKCHGFTFSLSRNAATSPVHHPERDSSPSTPFHWNMSPNEDSNSLLFSDSPGPDGLGKLSLDTPKRKAEVLGESMPSVGKAKLRRLSRMNNEMFINLKVIHYCQSCSFNSTS